MGWYFRDPRSFPALFHNVLPLAIERAPYPIVLSEVYSHQEAKSLLESFRWFKWCLRHPQGEGNPSAKLLLDHSFRGETIRDPVAGELLVYLRARRTILSDLLSLNPDLAAELEGIVN